MDEITALLKEARINADENRSKDVRHFAASVVEAIEELLQQLHDADEALKAVEKALADVDYRGSYAEGVMYLKGQLAAVAKERDEMAAQAGMLDRMVDERDEQLAAALAAKKDSYILAAAIRELKHK